MKERELRPWQTKGTEAMADQTETMVDQRNLRDLVVLALIYQVSSHNLTFRIIRALMVKQNLAGYG